MEYSKILPQQDAFSTFGLWNIPKKREQEKYWIWWNIEYNRGIFQKNSKKIKVYIILENRIFNGIFLEYSKNCKTSHGGVKFNQDYHKYDNYYRNVVFPKKFMKNVKKYFSIKIKIEFSISKETGYLWYRQYYFGKLM